MDAQDPIATIHGLDAFPGRGGGTDAERRAAAWLADRASEAGRGVRIETFWSRPNWALAHLWHVALALVGSLIALASPITGMVLLTIALASVISDVLAGISIGRRLTPEHASQNVIARGPEPSGPQRAPTRLVLTANYDAARIGLAYRVRPTTARLTRTLHGLTPGWLGWLSLAIIWLLAVAVIRQLGHTSQLIGAIQLPPTVGLLVGFALLLELATGNWSPSAGDNASGAAAAMALADALAASPPRQLELEVVLTGAGDGEQIGLRRYLESLRRRTQSQNGHRLRPRRHRSADTIVLAVAPCGRGMPSWWESDGALLPLRYSGSLRRVAAQIATDEPHLGARRYRGRGSGGASPARTAGLPSLTIGALDARDLAPDSHRKTDTVDHLDLKAIGRTVQFALLLIDGIDAALGAESQRAAAPTA